MRDLDLDLRRDLEDDLCRDLDPERCRCLRDAERDLERRDLLLDLKISFGLEMEL